MDIATLRHYLDDPSAAGRGCAAGAWPTRSGPTRHLLRHGCHAACRWTCWRSSATSWPALLVRCGRPDMALNNLDRFVAAARNPLAIGTLFERDPTALPTLVQIFSTSQHFSDLLVGDPEGFDLLRLTEGAPVARQMLVEDLVAEVEALDHDHVVLPALAAFQAARDAADRLRRHHPRAEPARRSPRRFPTWPTRSWRRRCGRPGGSCASSAARPAGPTASRPGSSCWAWASSAAAS